MGAGFGEECHFGSQQPTAKGQVGEQPKSANAANLHSQTPNTSSVAAWQHRTALRWPRVRAAPRDRRIQRPVPLRALSPRHPRTATWLQPPSPNTGRGGWPQTAPRSSPHASQALASSRRRIPEPSPRPPRGVGVCVRAAAGSAQPGSAPQGCSHPSDPARSSGPAPPPHLGTARCLPARREGRPRDARSGTRVPPSPALPGSRRREEPGTASPRSPSPRLWRSRQNGGGRRRTPARAGSTRRRAGRQSRPALRGKGASEPTFPSGIAPPAGRGRARRGDSPEAASASAALSRSGSSPDRKSVV